MPTVVLSDIDLAYKGVEDLLLPLVLTSSLQFRASRTSCLKDDGTIVFSGGCDKQVKMWPLISGGQPVTVAMHDAPIKEIAWVLEMNLLVTGIWDKTLK
ncbi:protein rae1 [Quercus suber]|uniref:Protein rae1 n=1 Tax=Quercus suber TaxID=58331 RepID=A0AAW0JIY3_QUESU